MNNLNPIITSIANEKIKSIRALAMKKNRNEQLLFVAEGLEHIQKAIEYDWQVETLLYVKNDLPTQEIFKSCRAQKADIYEVNDKVASYATNRDNPQKIIAVFAQKFHKIDVVKDGIWLGLENIRDSGNLGTIIRTADAVGVEGIILIGNTCDAFAPEVIRATTGSFSAVPLVQISTQDFVAWREGYKGKIVGTHLNKKAVDYSEVAVAAPTIILMGGEQAGLSAEITEICDVLAKIPMREGVESLNLAVSTAIILYELCQPKT
jgi:TrmH family RNA methyltransferase